MEGMALLALLGENASMKFALQKKGRRVKVPPPRSLADEKVQDFKRK